jgi:hypothetical protein
VRSSLPYPYKLLQATQQRRFTADCPHAGTAIAPFLPVPPAPVSFAWTPVHVFLFLVRLPIVLSLSVLFFGLIEWLPVGGTIRYAVLWALLGATGVWWVDFQVDGVKRGYVHNTPRPINGGLLVARFRKANSGVGNSQQHNNTSPTRAPSSPPPSPPRSTPSTSPASSPPSSPAPTPPPA